MNNTATINVARVVNRVGIMHRAKRIAAGEWEYQGRTIWRREKRRGAYNPWQVGKRSFATLADARAHVDQVMDRAQHLSESRANRGE